MGRRSRSARMSRPKPTVVADFETAQEEPLDGGLPDRTWVWLWAAAGVFDSELNLVGNSIDSFMEYALESAKLIFFHNLRFDGNFIIYWLLTHGYRHYEGDNHSPDRGLFSTVIS